MRDIEGIEKAISVLSPHMEEVEKNFNLENQKFIALMESPSDLMGRILKSHLVVEHYLEEYLSKEYDLQNVASAKLTFFQKVSLIHNQGKAASFVKPGILELNKIRNRFSHNLRANFSDSDIPGIIEVLKLSRPTLQANTMAKIEAFVTVACTFLIVSPPEIEKLFKEAFSNVSVSIRSDIESTEN